jgi:hypothetical protein
MTITSVMYNNSEGILSARCKLGSGHSGWSLCCGSLNRLVKSMKARLAFAEYFVRHAAKHF